MFDTIKLIGEKFRLSGELYSYSVITVGNINSTYKVTYAVGDNKYKAYLFQRINTHVFKNPVQIMKNIDEVTSYIRKKYPGQLTLHFHHTAEGNNYFVSDEDSFWRVMNYVDSLTLDNTDDLAVIEATGKAFGNFQAQLADFDGSVLYETIPDFHNTVKRFGDFKKAVAEDACGRAADVQKEIQFVLEREQLAHTLVDLQNAGKLPLRVTHNDTKLNNIMIDDVTHKGICVIDLDTVMPGLSLNDFGDSIRFGASTAAEDEQDISKVSCDLHLFEVYVKGFLEGCGGALTDLEVEMLPMGAILMTFECGMRFLADHLEGDHYFRIHRENHNLDRARTQFKLVWDMEQKLSEMKAIVQKYK